MKTRSESYFISLPCFGTRLYDRFSNGEHIQVQIPEIVRNLVSRIENGKLLDVGTGPGRLLLEINRLISGQSLLFEFRIS
jgi:predicted fused transcriptional regulator/phosphomethylpyrimidine kinase